MMSLTFGNKTWIFLNLNHLVAGTLSLSHVVLLSSESSMAQSIWGSVLWSLVHTGHCNVVIVEVSMFSLRQDKLVFPLGSSLVTSLPLVQSADTLYSQPHLRKKPLMWTLCLRGGLSFHCSQNLQNLVPMRCQCWGVVL